MASRTVRQTVRDWLNASGSVPYIDTVNLEEDPDLAMWCTVDWGYSFPTRETFCDEIREDGTFQVIFFGQTGVGDDDLLLAAEADMEVLLDQIDPNGLVSLKHYNGAEEFNDARYFAVSFLVDYEFRRP